MYERSAQPLLSKPEYYSRLASSAGLAVAILAFSLGVGMAGYRLTEGMPWLDAFLNAAMILGGMGPVDALTTPGGKAFAGIYALYSGVTFLLSVGVLFSPVFHRIMHQFHLPTEEDEAEVENEENSTMKGRPRKKK